MGVHELPRQRKDIGKNNREETRSEDVDDATYLARKYGIVDREMSSGKESGEADKKKEPPKK